MQEEEKIKTFIIRNIVAVMKDIQYFLDEYVCKDDCDACEYSGMCKWSESRW